MQRYSYTMPLSVVARLSHATASEVRHLPPETREILRSKRPRVAVKPAVTLDGVFAGSSPADRHPLDSDCSFNMQCTGLFLNTENPPIKFLFLSSLPVGQN